MQKNSLLRFLWLEEKIIKQRLFWQMGKCEKLQKWIPFFYWKYAQFSIICDSFTWDHMRDHTNHSLF